MICQSLIVELPWWKSLLNFFLKWNPLSWFFRQLRKVKMFDRFVEWVKNKLSPKVWHLTKDAMARGAMAAVGGIGSSLVNQFIETKDGKWNRALDGTQTNLPAQGVFGTTNAVPLSKPIAYGYGSQGPSETYPFSNK